MSTTRLNPYANLQGEWVRGSFHGHSAESSKCASVPLRESVHLYHAIGAHVVTLTDHDVVTPLDMLRREYPGLVLLHGFEYSSRENVVFVGDSVPPLHTQTLEAALAAAPHLLTIICHPQPRAGVDYWTQAKIRALGVLPNGIEVYNGHYGIPRMRDSGTRELYTPFWDELLTAGIRLWGFANDDFHDPADFSNAWNMVCVTARTADAVVDAAQHGRSYGTTGLLCTDLSVTDTHYRVTVDGDCVGRFVGPGGVELGKSRGRSFEYAFGDEAYVRFEGDASRGRIFMQPVFATAY